MQQFDLFTQFLAANLQKLQRAAEVIGGLEQRFVMERLQRSSATARTITGHSRYSHLDPHVPKPLLHVTLGVVHDLLELSAVSVHVSVDGLAALAARELI